MVLNLPPATCLLNAPDSPGLVMLAGWMRRGDQGAAGLGYERPRYCGQACAAARNHTCRTPGGIKLHAVQQTPGVFPAHLHRGCMTRLPSRLPRDEQARAKAGAGRARQRWWAVLPAHLQGIASQDCSAGVREGWCRESVIEMLCWEDSERQPSSAQGQDPQSDALSSLLTALGAVYKRCPKLGADPDLRCAGTHEITEQALGRLRYAVAAMVPVWFSLHVSCASKEERSRGGPVPQPARRSAPPSSGLHVMERMGSSRLLRSWGQCT